MSGQDGVGIDSVERARIHSAARIIADGSGNSSAEQIADRLVPRRVLLDPTGVTPFTPDKSRNIRWDGSTAVMDQCPYCNATADGVIVCSTHWPDCPGLNHDSQVGVSDEC